MLCDYRPWSGTVGGPVFSLRYIVTIYRSLQICRDGHLDVYRPYDIYTTYSLILSLNKLIN